MAFSKEFTAHIFKPSASLNYSRHRYGYDLWKNQSEDIIPRQEARAEYSRLRSIANKRISRLRGSRFENAAEAKRDFFPRLADIAEEGDVYWLLDEVSSFVVNDKSTITGQKERLASFIENMSDYYAVTDVNWRDVSAMLDYAKSIPYITKEEKYKLLELLDAKDDTGSNIYSEIKYYHDGKSKAAAEEIIDSFMRFKRGKDNAGKDFDELIRSYSDWYSGIKETINSNPNTQGLSVPNYLDLKAAAKAAGMSVEEFILDID